MPNRLHYTLQNTLYVSVIFGTAYRARKRWYLKINAKLTLGPVIVNISPFKQSSSAITAFNLCSRSIRASSALVFNKHIP